MTGARAASSAAAGADGTQRQIVRASMPFGAPGRGEVGTYYIAYAATPSVPEQMLTRS